MLRLRKWIAGPPFYPRPAIPLLTLQFPSEKQPAQEATPMPAWSLDRARHTYSIPYWSDGYFDVDAAGRMVALPRGAGGPALALPEVLEKATQAGLKLPL